MTFYSPSQFQAGPRLTDGTQQNQVEGNPQVTTDSAIVATGNSAATAYQLLATVNVLVTVAASTGVMLPPAVPGLIIYVLNRGASPLTVYGHTPGDLVDGLASVPLTNALRAAYFCIAPGLWFSAQLGVASA